MTSATVQMLIDQLQTPTAMAGYLRARLRGDAVSAPPAIDEYHGEDYTDLLIGLARAPTLPAGHLDWFWEGLLTVASEQWRDAEHEPFGRSALLAWQVGAPPGVPDKLAFLPANAAGFQWGIDARVRLGAHALLWLVAWQARPQPFWRENLLAVLSQAPAGEDKGLALVRAIDGVAALDHTLWSELLHDALGAPSFPTSTLRTALLVQWHRANADPALESLAINALGSGLAATRAQGSAPSSWAKLWDMINELSELPWSGSAKHQLQRLLEENDPRRIRERRSPKAYSNQPWREAA